jgi:hypothetical protein
MGISEKSKVLRTGSRSHFITSARSLLGHSQDRQGPLPGCSGGHYRSGPETAQGLLPGSQSGLYRAESRGRFPALAGRSLPPVQVVSARGARPGQTCPQTCSDRTLRIFGWTLRIFRLALRSVSRTRVQVGV